jgi:hypothetical protein
MMTWPRDKRKREHWIRSSKLYELRNHVGSLSEPTVRKALNIALETTPFRELAATVMNERSHGAIAGWLLARAIIEGQTSGTVNLGSIIKQFIHGSKQFRSPDLMRISEKTINNAVWPEFRSVAHYWAAYVLDKSVPKEWPCAISNLGMFLATAEAFREAGEAVRTKQGPVLRLGESVRAPETLLLPTVVGLFAGA